MKYVNAITVPCLIEGCFARVYNDVRCREHGGDPDYEWRTDIWGDVKYAARPEPTVPSNVPQEGQP